MKNIEKMVSFSIFSFKWCVMQSIVNKIFFRICGRGRGWAFSASDFITEFKRAQVDNALSSLAKDGKIRRVCRGVYDYPKYSNLLEQYLSPDFDQVAQAIARKFNWRIQPSGDTALNLLGLSTQIPGKITYLSDGPTKNFVLGNNTLEFKKSSLKNVGFKYKDSGLIVQALNALGRNQVEKIPINNFRKYLDMSKSKQVIKDTKSTTNWIFDYIKKIYAEGT